MSLALPAIAPAYIHSSVKRRKNVWVSARDGNWNDPTVWESNAIKRWNYPGQNIPTPIFPQVGDDVYINHTVKVNVAGLVVNNIYISGTLQFDTVSRAFYVNGDLQATGSVDLSNAAHNLLLSGINNYIVNFIPGTASIVSYIRNGDQNIMNVSYINLSIYYLGTKYLINNLTVSNGLIVNGPFNGQVLAGIDCLSFNLTVSGSSGNYGSFVKSGAGNILIIGSIETRNSFILSGNPTIETRGNVNFYPKPATLNTGTGTWNFTTNNATLSIAIFAPGFNFNGPLLIAAGITLSLSCGGGLYNPVFLNGINGASSTSKLLCLNNSGVQFNTLAQVTNFMTTGIFDYLTNSSILAYNLPSLSAIPYTVYRQLFFVANNGVEHRLSGNTTADSIYGDYNSGNSGQLNVLTYTLVVSGSIHNMYITGSGKITAATFNACTFSSNNDVECTLLLTSYSFGSSFTTGTGNWTFSTNNQSITHSVTTYLTFNGTVTISGAITLTLTNTPGTCSYTFISALNGNNAASNLVNMATIYHQASAAPMITGVLDTNTNANTFKYNNTGAQDVKGNTYRTLEFGGSGVKTLQGNVVVNTTAGGSWSITGTASINYNGYTITTI